MKQKGTKNFTFTQRLQLEVLYKAGVHKKKIAESLGVSLVTVYNELKRGACTYKQLSYTDYVGEKHYKEIKGYSPTIAQQKCDFNKSSHGIPLKIADNYDFVNYVEKRILQDRISTSAVVGEIKKNNLFSFTISKPTMYRYIEKGIFMHISLSDLPQGKRKKKYKKVLPKKAPKGTSIEKRTLSVAERSTFGNWEMDLVIGNRYSHNVLLVLTERLTRYEIILLLPDKKASTVVSAIDRLERSFNNRFDKIFKSITVDNGTEFSDFTGLERSIKGGKRTSIYYCHPYCSSERGTNERINRDIRRLCPKGTDFSKFSQKQISYIQDWLNSYPREIFNFSTPTERFIEELAKL